MKHIISSGLYLLILLCISVFIFDPSNLYFEIKWLDIPMHILGGFGVASFVQAVAAYKKHTISFIAVLAAYLCVAIVWELYEVAHDIMRQTSWNGWQDSLSDIINGAIGATVSYFFFKNN